MNISKFQNWKNKFEKSSSEFVDKDELELEYKFGDPATEDQLSEVEKSLRICIPDSLRTLLLEFNGIEAKDKYRGWNQLYLSTSNIMKEIPEYIQDSGNPMPPNDHLSKVIFFSQQNGFAVLYAVCVEPFETYLPNQIVAVESDAGEFYLACESLSEFVSSSEYCHLS